MNRRSQTRAAQDGSKRQPGARKQPATPPRKVETPPVPRGSKGSKVEARPRLVPGTPIPPHAEPLRPAASVRIFRRRTLKSSEVLADEILRDVVRRGLKEGDPLPLEGDMVVQYHAGRSTVREALRILEINGFITIRSGPQGGPKVRGPNPTDFGRMIALFLQAEKATVRDLVEARRILESAMVADATRRRDVAFLQRAARLAEWSKTVDIHDDDQYLALCREFHEAMASASSNRVFSFIGLALMSIFWGKLDRGIFPPKHRRAMLDEHDEILRAILGGHAAKAEQLMNEHMAHYIDGIAARYPHALDDPIRWQ